MGQHVMLTVTLLNAYTLEFIADFPYGEGDLLRGRSTDGCTVIFEVAAERIRPEQQAYLDGFRDAMIDRLELLRMQGARRVRGLTLFEWKAHKVPEPRHDLALLNRRRWKDAILAAAAV